MINPRIAAMRIGIPSLAKSILVSSQIMRAVDRTDANMPNGNENGAVGIPDRLRSTGSARQVVA